MTDKYQWTCKGMATSDSANGPMRYVREVDFDNSERKVEDLWEEVARLRKIVPEDERYPMKSAPRMAHLHRRKVMSKPTIVRIAQIKTNINLAQVVMSDGSVRFSTKQLLPRQMVLEYYRQVALDVKNPQIEDLEQIRLGEQESKS